MRYNFTLLRPATLDLAEHVGRALSAPDITQERRDILRRIRESFAPEARARCDAADVEAFCHDKPVPACRLVAGTDVPNMNEAAPGTTYSRRDSSEH